MTRPDVHSPKNLTTEDYEYATGGDFGGMEDPAWTDTDGLRALAADGWLYAASSRALCESPTVENPEEASGCACQHCGAHLRYYAVLKHIPSHSLIIVGEQCLSNRFERATADFQKLRRQAELRRADRRIVKAREKFVAEHPEFTSALAAENARGEAGEHTDSFLISLYWQLQHKGELSERQIRFGEDAVAKAEERRAQREAEKANEPPAAPVIEGRIVITGTVLATKWQDSDFGGSLKMLVRDDRGFKVWGTVPSIIDEIHKGDRIEFTGTVEVSRDDETFGFFKRPSKARITEMAPEEVTA